MPKFKPQDHFNMKTTSPSTLKENNLISFNYKSPDGVHDPNPLVLVFKRESDRIYGFNLHYDMKEMKELMTNIDTKVMEFLKKEYFKKYPENKQKLLKERKEFGKDLITEQEYKEFMRKYPQNELEMFLVGGVNIEICRCYLYKRMNAVSKLSWKMN